MSCCWASSEKWYLMCKRKTRRERTILCLCQCVRFNNKISKLQAMPVTCKIVYRVAQLPTNPNIRFYFQIFKLQGGHNNKDWKSSPASSVIKAFLSAVPMLYNFLVRSFPWLANPVVSGIYSYHFSFFLSHFKPSHFSIKLYWILQCTHKTCTWQVFEHSDQHFHSERQYMVIFTIN